MEIDDRFAKEHIHKWIRAWNDHNLRKVISLYSENISFSSPKIKAAYPNRDSSTITNKKDLEEYFSSGLKKFPMFHFMPIDYFLKNDKRIQWSVIENFTFDNDALIEKSTIYYGAEDWIGNSRPH